MGGHVENFGPPNLSQFLIKVVTDEYPESQEALFRQFDIEDMRLFDSKARGTGHTEADLDLFIMVPVYTGNAKKQSIPCTLS